jgi:acetyl esterase/lipase
MAPRLQKVLRVLAISFGAVLALVAAAWVYLYRPDSCEGTNPPRGYSSRSQIFAAVAVRALRLVDTTPSLPPGVVETKGVEYGRAGDRSLQLDLYEPKGRGTTRVPGLIFIHGGAWRSGKREDYRAYTTWFAARGYVVATVSYRLQQVAKFPAALEDCKAAVRWMRANAPRLGVDPDRIVVLGGSAGGHLSMMIAYTGGDRSFEGNSGHPGVSSTVAAVVDLYGPTDLTTPFGQAARVVWDFLSCKYDEDPELWRRASPLFHLDSNAPPTLVFHGTLDDIVPIDQADSLFTRLRELGVRHEYYRLDGWPHTMDLARPVNDFCRRRIARFLEQLPGANGPRF